MDLVFEKITQTLAAGQRWPSQIAGNFFRLAVAAYPVSVSIIKDFRVVGTMQNMLAGDYVKDIEFDGVVVLNGSTAQDVTIQISGGGAGSDRVLGEVSVINGEIAKVKANQAFIGIFNSPPVAGQYSHSQLWNAVGSGKTVVLTKISVSGSSVPGLLGLVRFTAQLANNISSGVSKKLGGANSASTVKYENNAAQLGVSIGNFAIPTAYDSRDFSFSEPIILPEGYGAGIVSSSVNIGLYGTFQWNEE